MMQMEDSKLAHFWAFLARSESTIRVADECRTAGKSGVLLRQKPRDVFTVERG